MTDSNKKYQLGDVEIKKLTITRMQDNKPFDIQPQTIQLSVFEDFLSPSIMVDVYIVDAIGMLKSLPIIGEEIIDLEFETPGRQSYKIKTRVYEVVLGSAADNQTQQSYCLKCISEESFTNSIVNVEKGYKDKIDSMIKDILSSELKTKKKIFYEETKGIQNITFIRKNPFEAIEMLRKRAASQKYQTSTFFFFENKYGYNFNTLEGLMDQNKGKIGDKIFTRYVILKENQDPQGFRQILSYNIGRQFNMINSLTLGSLKARHETFDILKKEFKKVDYNIQDFPQFKNSEKSGATSPFGQKTITDFSKDTSAIYYNISNSDNPDTYLNDILAKKIAYSAIMLGGTIELYCYGDSDMTTGDVVEIKMPKTDGLTKNQPQPEPLSPGAYIITRLHHSIQWSSSRPKYTMTCSCARGIYKQ